MLERLEEHINQIREEVRNERVKIAELNTKVINAAMKEQLKKLVSDRVDYVDLAFHEISLREDRTAAQWAYLIRGANVLLQEATKARKEFEEYLRMSGLDAVSIR
jgi:hypothetical protein